jgi:CBS domain-containing protein
MTCRTLMSRNPATLRPDDTVADAARRIAERKRLTLPVVEPDGCYVGLFGVPELLGLLLPAAAAEGLLPDLAFLSDDTRALRERLAGRADEPVGPLAATDLPVLRPDTPLVEGLFLMRKHRSPLPVVAEEDGKLLGLLSFWEALEAVRGESR